MDYNVSATNKPKQKKHARSIEFEPANEQQEESQKEMIETMLKTISMWVNDRHKKNRVVIMKVIQIFLYLGMDKLKTIEIQAQTKLKTKLVQIDFKYRKLADATTDKIQAKKEREQAKALRVINNRVANQKRKLK